MVASGICWDLTGTSGRLLWCREAFRFDSTSIDTDSRDHLSLSRRILLFVFDQRHVIQIRIRQMLVIQIAQLC